MPIRNKEETEAMLQAAREVVAAAEEFNLGRFGVNGTQAILHGVSAVIAATAAARNQQEARDMILEIFEIVNRLRGVTQG